jgi:hypothetical protein
MGLSSAALVRLVAVPLVAQATSADVACGVKPAACPPVLVLPLFSSALAASCQWHPKIQG